MSISFRRAGEYGRLRDKVMPGWRLYRKRQKEIFKAVVLDNMTYQQVGDRFGITVNTVKTMYYRALKQLKEELEETLWCCFLLFAISFYSFILL